MARDGKRVSAFKPGYEPTSVSFHPSQPEVAIGGKVSVIKHVYSCRISYRILLTLCACAEGVNSIIIVVVFYFGSGWEGSYTPLFDQT